MNYYETLGVDKSANPEQIKQAYRRLASKFHPDKGGDTARFQEIQTAYETLSDPNKRQQYDNPQPQHQHFNFNFDSGNLDDIFGNFFGRGANPFQHARQQPRRNRNIQARIQLGLQETLTDCHKTLNIQTGNNQSRNVDIVIPKGITPSSTIRFPGLGDRMFENLPPGDLLLTVDILRNPNYEVQGLDLTTSLTLDCFDAILGSEQQVVGLDGKVFVIRTPAGCQPGTKLKISGEGLWQFQNDVKGNLFVRINISIPKNLTQEQVNLVRSIKTVK